jgi:hypothetical protein
MSEPEPWQVRIGLSDSESVAIERAMFAVWPSENWGLRVSQEEESSLTLLIDVQAESHAAAEATGERVYAAAREQAGLPPEPLVILSVLTPLFAAAPHDRLLDEAVALIDSQRYDWAVVRAQTTCELYAEKALGRLARGLADDDQKPLRKVSLTDPRDRALLQALTGIAMQEQAWWSSYRVHLRTRNQIVHAAFSASRQEAVASLEAARSFVGFLRDRWAGASDVVRPGRDDS